MEGGIEPNLYQETRRIFSEAVADGWVKASDRDIPTPGQAFRDAFLHSADVFSAFRVHRMQQDIAAQMIDSNGNVKPFRKFVKDVSPYIEHRNREWLQTEYNTAILRAQNAAEWQQFMAEKDVFPNLEWIPSTSPNPGEDHRVFWGTVRPVDDPFWNVHKPGDRWNCKCELRQSEKAVTPVPTSRARAIDNAAKGLESNPAKDKEVFSDKHPYYPKNCSVCPFAGNKLMALVHDLAGGKDCHHCRRVNKAIEKEVQQQEPVKVLLKEFKNGGRLSEYSNIPRDKSDYKALRTIGRLFASNGSDACLTPRVHFKDAKYREIYGSLVGTIYERKCPDLLIDGEFYEYEGFIRPWSKKKVGRMLSHGIDQSDKIIIDNTKGCSHRFIRKLIVARQKESKNPITEVWVYEKGNLTAVLKDGKFL